MSPVMATALASTGITGKRKRNIVNYAMFDATDVDFEDDLLDNATSSDDEDADLPEDDSVYGSRTKTAKSIKQKRASKKRARLASIKASTPQKPFPFLALPAELRDYIYELALVEPEGITLVSKTKAYRRTVARGAIYDGDRNWSYRYHSRRASSSDSDIPQRAGLVPSLLAVNKQIHAEAFGYLYKQPIILEDTMALHTFIAAVGSHCKELTDVVVRGWGDGRGTHKAMNFASLTLLAGCTSLKSLRFDCVIGWSRTPKQLARQLYRDGHYFFEAFGAVGGRKDAALGILRLGEGNYDHWRSSGKLDKEEWRELFDAEMRMLLKV